MIMIDDFGSKFDCYFVFVKLHGALKNKNDDVDSSR